MWRAFGLTFRLSRKVFATKAFYSHRLLLSETENKANYNLRSRSRQFLFFPWHPTIATRLCTTQAPALESPISQQKQTGTTLPEVEPDKAIPEREGILYQLRTYYDRAQDEVVRLVRAAISSWEGPEKVKAKPEQTQPTSPLSHQAQPPESTATTATTEKLQSETQAADTVEGVPRHDRITVGSLLRYAKVVSSLGATFSATTGRFATKLQGALDTAVNIVKSSQNIPGKTKVWSAAHVMRIKEALEQIAATTGVSRELLEKLKPAERERMADLWRIQKTTKELIDYLERQRVYYTNNWRPELEEALPSMHRIAVGAQYVSHVIEENIEKLAIKSKSVVTRVSTAATAPITASEEPPNPVLFVPGIGGNQLRARRRDAPNGGQQAVDEVDVWLRTSKCNQIFEKFMYVRYCPDTGIAESIHPHYELYAPQDNHGLAALAFLNSGPGSDDLLTLPYFHVMLQRMRKAGYVDGKTLFGLPFDFRQNTWHKKVLDALETRLRDIRGKTGKKVDIVSHSFGGLLVRSFLGLRPETATSLIRRWVTIASPFQGGSGKAMLAPLCGYDFDMNFISEKILREMQITIPAVYELLPSRDYTFRHQPPSITYHRHGHRWRLSHPDFIEIYRLANGVCGCPGNGHHSNHPLLAWNDALWEAAQQHRALLRQRTNYPGILFVNIYGIGIRTPIGLVYPKEIREMSELKMMRPDYEYGDGDFVVGVETATQDMMDNAIRIGIRRTHTEMLFNKEVFQLVLKSLRNKDSDLVM